MSDKLEFLFVKAADVKGVDVRGVCERFLAQETDDFLLFSVDAADDLVMLGVGFDRRLWDGRLADGFATVDGDIVNIDDTDSDINTADLDDADVDDADVDDTETDINTVDIDDADIDDTDLDDVDADDVDADDVDLDDVDADDVDLDDVDADDTDLDDVDADDTDLDDVDDKNMLEGGLLDEQHTFNMNENNHFDTNFDINQNHGRQKTVEHHTTNQQENELEEPEHELEEPGLEEPGLDPFDERSDISMTWDNDYNLDGYTDNGDGIIEFVVAPETQTPAFIDETTSKNGDNKNSENSENSENDSTDDKKSLPVNYTLDPEHYEEEEEDDPNNKEWGIPKTKVQQILEQKTSVTINDLLPVTDRELQKMVSYRVPDSLMATDNKLFTNLTVTMSMLAQSARSFLANYKASKLANNHIQKLQETSEYKKLCGNIASYYETKDHEISIKNEMISNYISEMNSWIDGQRERLELEYAETIKARPTAEELYNAERDYTDAADELVDSIVQNIEDIKVSILRESANTEIDLNTVIDFIVARKSIDSLVPDNNDSGAAGVDAAGVVDSVENYSINARLLDPLTAGGVGGINSDGQYRATDVNVSFSGGDKAPRIYGTPRNFINTKAQTDYAAVGTVDNTSAGAAGSSLGSVSTLTTPVVLDGGFDGQTSIQPPAASVNSSPYMGVGDNDSINLDDTDNTDIVDNTDGVDSEGLVVENMLSMRQMLEKENETSNDPAVREQMAAKRQAEKEAKKQAEKQAGTPDNVTVNETDDSNTTDDFEEDDSYSETDDYDGMDGYDSDGDLEFEEPKPSKKRVVLTSVIVITSLLAIFGGSVLLYNKFIASETSANGGQNVTASEHAEDNTSTNDSETGGTTTNTNTNTNTNASGDGADGVGLESNGPDGAQEKPASPTETIISKIRESQPQQLYKKGDKTDVNADGRTISVTIQDFNDDGAICVDGDGITWFINNDQLKQWAENNPKFFEERI